MNYSEIKYCDIANGVGVRTSLFVSGCRRHCVGCFNKCTWSFSYGFLFNYNVQEKVLSSLEPSYVDGLTVLGGDPMEPENQEGIVGFLEEAKRRFHEKTIWMYTGYLYEDLVNGFMETEYTSRILKCVDVLVDGPFMESLKDITLRFKGSSNQRIIDVPKSLESGSVKLWSD